MTAKFLEAFTMLVLVIVYFAIMFIPTYVAFFRRHDHRIGIFVINFFLGWTGVGWAAMMVWALTEEAGSAAAAGAQTPVGSGTGD